MFQAPNHTQVPNTFLDEMLPSLTHVETKVLLVIMRKTFGWHKIRDRISLSQLESHTGAQRQAILRATKSLVAKNLITKQVEGKEGSQQTFYELVIEDSKNSYQCDQHTPPSVIITPTKETLTKENICVSNACAREKDVETTEEEHQKLVQEHGLEKTQRFYKRLSEWKQDTPKSKWKKSDYRSILRWVIVAETKADIEQQGVEKWQKNQKSQTRSKGSNATSLDRDTSERILPPQGLIMSMLNDSATGSKQKKGSSSSQDLQDVEKHISAQQQ